MPVTALIAQDSHRTGIPASGTARGGAQARSESCRAAMLNDTRFSRLQLEVDHLVLLLANDVHGLALSVIQHEKRAQVEHCEAVGLFLRIIDPLMRAVLAAQDTKSVRGATQAENATNSCGKHNDSVMLCCCGVLKSRRVWVAPVRIADLCATYRYSTCHPVGSLETVPRIWWQAPPTVLV